jgi:hypothetical protein
MHPVLKMQKGNRFYPRIANYRELWGWKFIGKKMGAKILGAGRDLPDS